MRDILVQCFRNALFHGLEPEQERLSVGKAPVGCIGIEATASERGLEVHIRDDGRGLALGALREVPSRQGWTDEQLAECVFQSGVSTAKEVGLVAGRGVGLDIVRDLLRSGGGDVTIRFTGSEKAGFRPFSLVLLLPSAAVLSDGRSRSNDRLIAAE